MPLRKTTIRNTAWVKDDDTDTYVLHADDAHALIMAAGYLKFKFAKKEVVYFRGQRKLYGSLVPTLYRGVKTQKAQGRRHKKLSELINEFVSNAPIFNKFGDYAHEPLLQHYGISTTWIDLVDNIWVALWFACYRALAIGKSKEFMHFEKRAYSLEERYAYILLIAADTVSCSHDTPGYFPGRNTELVDLRMSAPSVFLRPHSQHERTGFSDERHG